jgi:hypothetical protein
MWIATVIALVVAAAAGLLYARRVSAHCDTMDGPVVKAARQALETGNLKYVLPWVGEEDEAQIKAAFEHARKVRALGPEAKSLADNYFFETLVRVHRAGEGAPYTGLKPAGSEVNPAVAASDKAFETGSADALVTLLTKAVKQRVESRFAEALAAQSKDINNVGARRRGVHAYVEFVHYAEGIYNSAAGGAGEAAAAHGHE